MHLSNATFKLDEGFVTPYRTAQPEWSTLGLVTFLRTYARTKADGSKESWGDCLERVTTGTFRIQEAHCRYHKLPWDADKAQRTAQRMFQAMWEFKFLPPGRGLWSMGTEHVEKVGGASLNNCGFVSTEHLDTDPIRPFTFLMDMMMLGVGVGFDVMGAGKVYVHGNRHHATWNYVVEDSREGWVGSVYTLLSSYVKEDVRVPNFDYTLIRPAGTPLKLFGGVSSGAGPLIRLHQDLTALLESRKGKFLTSVDILDMMNMIGKCVVSGNIRRGAEIALGASDDTAFITAKQDRMALNSHRWASNNTILSPVGMDYGEVGKSTAINGEPGYFWLENAQKFGRMIDGETHRDLRVRGTNPCGEQSLEPYELCCLVETFPARHGSLQDYLDTLKLAYLYAKTITLVPTHWPETNAVMLRNRRIGCSQSGITRAFSRHGRRTMFTWCDTAYKYLQGLDIQYSSWLCIPESVKKTSVKPSGTVSLLAGEPPGIHYPHAEYYIRRVRFSTGDPLVQALTQSGYKCEVDAYTPSSVVVEFPCQEAYFTRSESEVSMWEQALNAVMYQRLWSDNQVSTTIKFSPREALDIPRLLELLEGELKSISFLPKVDHQYEQPPYEEITRDEYTTRTALLRAVDVSTITGGVIGSEFCDGDRCTTPLPTGHA